MQVLNIVRLGKDSCEDAAARHAGIKPVDAIASLAGFVLPRRRMELKGVVNGISVYDDFAHHPTAIATTIAGLRAKVGAARILAVLEPRANTMKMGVHQAELANALVQADLGYLSTSPNLGWDIQQVAAEAPLPCSVYLDIDLLVEALAQEAKPGDHILLMSNGGFGGIHDKLIARLKDYHGEL